MPDEIATAFQRRRQLALAVAGLAHAEDVAGLAAAAREIYAAYPNELIQAELLRNLDTPDSQLRGGLGQLAALLPPATISAALRTVAADRGQSAQRRLTAAMLASQYLGEPIPAALLSDLSKGNEVAFQSLLEAVEEGKRNRHVLLEYVMQMREAGDHVPHMVMELLDRLPEADRVGLLRLIALDDREGVAINALGRLELLASAAASEEALRALHVLQFMLPPELAGFAEDALRRQRFRGIVYRPPEPVGWRALLGIADLTGHQALWFVRMPPDGEAGVILYLDIDNYTGQMDALADEEMHVDELPPQQPIGQVLPIDTNGGRKVSFVEAPFDFARWRVLKLLSNVRQVPHVLPPEFRLYADRIWEFARPETPVMLQRFFEVGVAGEGADARNGDPFAEAAAMTAELLEHPAMSLWLQHNRSMFGSIPEELALMTSEQRASIVRTVLTHMEQQPERQNLSAALAAGLRAQAAWFEIAGNGQTAETALALSESIPYLPVSQNPLLAAVIDYELRHPRQPWEKPGPQAAPSP